MGTYNYIVIPKMKVMFMTKVSYDDEVDEKYIKTLTDEDNYVEINNETKIDSLQTISEMCISVKNYNKLFPIQRSEELLLYYLTLKDIDYLIISENSDELDKYKDFIKID